MVRESGEQVSDLVAETSPVGEEVPVSNTSELTELKSRAEILVKKLEEINQRALELEGKAQLEKQSKCMELTRARAKAAAQRLLQGRVNFATKHGHQAIIPSNEAELVDLVDSLAKQSRRFGVFLTKSDRQALLVWHTYVRARIQRKKREQEAAPTGEALSAILAPEDQQGGPGV